MIFEYICTFYTLNVGKPIYPEAFTISLWQNIINSPNYLVLAFTPQYRYSQPFSSSIPRHTFIGYLTIMQCSLLTVPHVSLLLTPPAS